MLRHQCQKQHHAHHLRHKYHKSNQHSPTCVETASPAARRQVRQTVHVRRLTVPQTTMHEYKILEVSLRLLCSVGKGVVTFSLLDSIQSTPK